MLFTGVAVTLFASCDTRTKEQKAEDKLQAQHPYNHKLQGPGLETHENQFYISRGKPALGAKMEAQAAAGEPTEVKMAGDTLQNNK
ncbi:hypothetical protein AM493_18680 [Flavobacterium akiainvivens]|uniref:Uncharacterized protein n=2 Tax=Flavobacterium akiainvivens TaxID=1202724 RepID=A0A0N0RR43_9FLAO|nr:hypothetical protein AM493_18680 [Flavobacterium akiainvivens]